MEEKWLKQLHPVLTSYCLNFEEKPAIRIQLQINIDDEYNSFLL